MSTKYQGVIVTKLADQEIPDDFISKVLEARPTTSGFAVAIENGESGIIKMDGSSGSDTTLEQVKEVQEDYKDSTCIFYFSSFPKEFNEKSCQPFPVIVNETEDTEMVVFMDGTFDKKTLATSKNSPEYDVFEKYLKPALVRIWKGADKEIHATMEEISTDPSLADLIGMLYEEQATVLILASNGEMVTFGRNEKEVSYEWGHTSDACGFGEKTVVAKVADAVKRGLGGARNLKGAAVTASPVSSAIPANVAASGTSEAEKYHSPPLSATKAEKSEWYLANNEGVIPPGYKSCPKILKLEYRPIKTLADKRVNAVAASKRPIADVVPARAKEKSTGATGTDKSVSAEVLPILSPPDLKSLATFIQSDALGKIINEGKSILDPARIAELEKKYSTFDQIAGLSGLEDTFPWPFEAWVLLGEKVGIRALALLGWNTSLFYQLSLADEAPEPELPLLLPESPVIMPKKSRLGGSHKLG